MKTDRKQKRFGGVISRIDGYEECCKLTMQCPLFFQYSEVPRWENLKKARLKKRFCEEESGGVSFCQLFMICWDQFR